MSILHFVTCYEYKKRVIQLGENPNSVFNVGSLAIENCLNVELLREDILKTKIGIPLKKPYCVVTFHPVTLEKQASKTELYELITALDEFPDYSYIITMSNSDAGGNQINTIWKQEAAKRNNFYVISSMGMLKYLSALRYCEMMIGNSSSGTTEGPAMHIPTIDIGNRQKGRFFAESVIHCEPIKKDIVYAMNRANESDFRIKVKKATNPFGDGTTSDQIIEILKKVTADNLEVKKDFYDISFEV